MASRSSCICTSSPQSVGGPRAGEIDGGSSGSPRCVRILRMGPGLGKERNEPDVSNRERAEARPRPFLMPCPQGAVSQGDRPIFA